MKKHQRNIKEARVRRPSRLLSGLLFALVLLFTGVVTSGCGLVDSYGGEDVEIVAPPPSTTDADSDKSSNSDVHDDSLAEEEDDLGAPYGDSNDNPVKDNDDR